MKYFNINVITREHVVALKETLKKYTKNKIINYNNNFIDHLVMEKGILIKDKENEILSLIEEHLEPWLDDWSVLQKQINEGCWIQYNYYKLPTKLKQYMFKVDMLLYQKWIRNLTYSASVDDYERREEKLKVMIPDYTEEEYRRYVLLGHTIPTPLGRKARDSARRAYKTVNEIIKCNMDKFQTFMTFTLANKQSHLKLMSLNDLRKVGEVDLQFDYIDGKDFEEVKKRYTMVMKNLGKKLKRKGIPFEYITVWELQTNGNYHFHVLCTRIPEEETYEVPEWLDYNHEENKRYNGKGLVDWNHGKSDVQDIKDKSRITTYVSKYIIKSFENVNEETYLEYLNKKKYYPSKGLIRPITTYYSEDEEIDTEAFEGLEPFVKTYTNPYNFGLHTNNRYTLVGQAN